MLVAFHPSRFDVILPSSKAIIEPRNSQVMMVNIKHWRQQSPSSFRCSMVGFQFYTDRSRLQTYSYIEPGVVARRQMVARRQLVATQQVVARWQVVA